MPHISLPEGLPGISSAFAYRPETAKPMRELAEVLLRGPNTLTSAERETIAAFVSHRNECHFCMASHRAAAAHHQGGDYTALMQGLRSALGGRLLTAAVIAGANFSAGLAIQPPVFDLVDWLNIMTYDDNLAGQPHASYDFMVYYCNQWLARGLPAGKLVAGIPFYARPGGRSYASFVAADRANADRDVVDGAGYNGRPTVRAKTQWAKANAGGVMFWELSQDTHDDTSLVAAISSVAGSGDWFTECFGGAA